MRFFFYPQKEWCSIFLGKKRMRSELVQHLVTSQIGLRVETMSGCCDVVLDVSGVVIVKEL